MSVALQQTTEQERRVKAIQQKLDRLDEAFLYSESIDLTSYGRPRDKLREELTLAKIEQTTPKRSTNSTYREFWRSQNAFCRAHRNCGSRLRLTTNSGCRRCSSREELRTTETDSIEPP